jgi:transcriptional regulator with XRE-family HTH domain
MASKNSTLGSLIRLVRKKNSWTLRQLSEKVGIPLSTLAKVETDKLSLTYDKLQQFTASLGLSMTEFLAQADAPPAATLPVFRARRSLTGRGNSIQISTPNYDYEYLCADLRQKRMVPILTRIRSKDIAEFGEPLKHKGEEFIFVIEGTVEVHLQFYSPVRLTAGQGIYIDSTMGHAYVAKDCESALVLGVCSSEDPAARQGSAARQRRTPFTRACVMGFLLVASRMPAGFSFVDMNSLIRLTMAQLSPIGHMPATESSDPMTRIEESEHFSGNRSLRRLHAGKPTP